MASEPGVPRRAAPAVAAIMLAAVLVLALAVPADAGRKHRDRHRVDLSGETKNVRTTASGALVDRGTVSGKPFGRGKIKLVVFLHPEDQTATGRFRIRNRRGTAFGTIDVAYVIDVPGNEINFDGTADLTGGKGRYKGIRARDLKAHDRNTLDGQNGTVTLKGFARY